MSALIIGTLVFLNGRCGSCGTHRAMFVDLGGRWVCAGCAARERAS